MILVLVVALGPSPTASPPQGAADSPAAASAIPDDLPAPIREELAMLEARLRVRDARVREAESFLEIERADVEETKRERGLGMDTPRAVQIAEIRLAEAETQLEARRAERAQVAEMLDRLRRRIASPSPEADLDELRAALEGEVRSAEARLRAQEARLRAAELKVESDLASQENLLRAIRGGYVSALSLKRAHQVTNALRIWRDRMEAERDLARVSWERQRRRLDAFDRGDRPEDDPEPSTPEQWRARVEQLEDEVRILREEVLYLEGSLMRPRLAPSAP